MRQANPRKAGKAEPRPDDGAEWTSELPGERSVCQGDSTGTHSGGTQRPSREAGRQRTPALMRDLP
jgi:hypothetical protein